MKALTLNVICGVLFAGSIAVAGELPAPSTSASAVTVTYSRLFVLQLHPAFPGGPFKFTAKERTKMDLAAARACAASTP